MSALFRYMEQNAEFDPLLHEMQSCFLGFSRAVNDATLEGEFKDQLK